MPPKRDSNSVTRRTHVMVDQAMWIFQELFDRIGIRATSRYVGVSMTTMYNWKKGNFWRMNRVYVKAAMELLLEVRREQAGWTPQEAKQMRVFIKRTKQAVKARKHSMRHDVRDPSTGQWLPKIDAEAVAARLAENAINLEEFGRESLAQRAVERAQNSASTNGVVKEVPTTHGN